MIPTTKGIGILRLARHITAAFEHQPHSYIYCRKTTRTTMVSCSGPRFPKHTLSSLPRHPLIQVPRGSRSSTPKPLSGSGARNATREKSASSSSTLKVPRVGSRAGSPVPSVSGSAVVTQHAAPKQGDHSSTPSGKHASSPLASGAGSRAGSPLPAAPSPLGGSRPTLFPVHLLQPPHQPRKINRQPSRPEKLGWSKRRRSVAAKAQSYRRRFAYRIVQ